MTFKSSLLFGIVKASKHKSQVKMVKKKRIWYLKKIMWGQITIKDYHDDNKVHQISKFSLCLIHIQWISNNCIKHFISILDF